MLIEDNRTAALRFRRNRAVRHGPPTGNKARAPTGPAFRMSLGLTPDLVV
jgi:hypothetical protein